MGNVAQAAITHMTDAAAIPLAAPGGCETCPRGAVRIGVFFDGTGNNRFRDEPHDVPLYSNDPMKDNGRSAVSKIHELYIEHGTSQKKIYHHGVGTDSYQREHPENTTEYEDHSSFDITGGAGGAGGKGRVDWGLKQLADFFSNHGNHLAVEKLFDIYGFSRGAAIARDFVSSVRTKRIDNLKQPNGHKWTEDRDGNVVYVPAYQAHKEPTPMFLGIFDTVASFGLAGFQTSDQLNGYEMFVDHTFVRRTIHLIAEDEFRVGFPVTSLFADPNDEGSWIWTYQPPSNYRQTMVEIWYPGAHCDVGGAYLLRHPIAADGVRPPDEPGKEPGDRDSEGHVTGKRQHLANIPLRDMHIGSLKATVPLRPLNTLSPSKLWEVPGDLEDFYSKYDSYRQPTEYGVGKRYIQTFESEKYRHLFYDLRIKEPNFERLKFHFIHNSAAEFQTSFIDNHRWQRTVFYMGGVTEPNQPKGTGPTER